MKETILEIRSLLQLLSAEYLNVYAESDWYYSEDKTVLTFGCESLGGDSLFLKMDREEYPIYIEIMECKEEQIFNSLEEFKEYLLEVKAIQDENIIIENSEALIEHMRRKIDGFTKTDENLLLSTVMNYCQKR